MFIFILQSLSFRLFYYTYIMPMSYMFDLQVSFVILIIIFVNNFAKLTKWEKKNYFPKKKRDLLLCSSQAYFAKKLDTKNEKKFHIYIKIF